MKRLAGLCALLSIAMLAACAKSNDGASASSSPQASTQASAAASAPVQNGAMANDGAKVYLQNCASCHQAGGQGVTDTFPPLDGNPVVTSDAASLIHIVKYGLNGKITVAKSDYNGMMPAWAQQLSDADIASVVTYIRSAWTNKAGAVTESQVAGVSQ
ncbi:MAG TPA: cytochrome c [Candidatus Acidoferrales bacterium]|nr:cytochrome c [Candidatus Acidoferrales bacterium]